MQEEKLYMATCQAYASLTWPSSPQHFVSFTSGSFQHFMITKDMVIPLSLACGEHRAHRPFRLFLFMHFIIRSHIRVGSATASTTTASVIVAFSEAYIRIIKNGVRTYTHDITLQVLLLFLYTTPPIRRRIAFSLSLHLLWIDCAV